MGKKKQKIKGQNWKRTKNSISHLLSLGLNREDYEKELKKENKTPDEIIDWMNKYDEEKPLYALTEDQTKEGKKIFELINQKKENDLYVYFPLMKVIHYHQLGNVAFLSFKTEHDFTFYDKDTNTRKTYYKGMKDAFNLKGLFDTGELVLGDHTTKEIFTKHTEFKEIEIEKIKTETKIVKQEVKTGTSKKKIEKAKEKTIHEFSKRWQKEAVEDVLNHFINQL